MDIIRIYKVNNFSITNLVDGGTFKNQSIIVVEYRDGSKRILDLVANTDITDKVNNKYLKLNINDEIMKKAEIVWEEE